MSIIIEDDDLLNAELPDSADKPKFNTNKPNGKPNGKTAAAAAPAFNPTFKWGDPSVKSGDGLDRVKATTERQVRFALVPNTDPAGGMTHFVSAGPRKLLAICPGHGCPQCPREDARWNGVALIVHYTNADQNGRIPAEEAPKYAIGYISLSATHFKTLSEAAEGCTVFDIDWIMSFDGKRFGYRPVSTVPRYRKAGDEEAVVKLAAPFHKRLAGKVGRKISALDLKALIAGAPTLEAGLEGMEED
jgi:hypothetical protein